MATPNLGQSTLTSGSGSVIGTSTGTGAGARDRKRTVAMLDALELSELSELPSFGHEPSVTHASDADTPPQRTEQHECEHQQGQEHARMFKRCTGRGLDMGPLETQLELELRRDAERRERGMAVDSISVADTKAAGWGGVCARAARALHAESVDAMLAMEDAEIEALEQAVQAEHRNLVEKGLIAP